ncbi:MAG: VWA domain-containing protein [Thermoflexia bacterium]|nr:MAG: VWA domain-containing protein [Thermoflexia bacterium]
MVEREGISFSHPARFILIGTMNPEEGDLRPQLLDRFALCVDIRSVQDPAARMLIMERNLAFESDPEGFYEEWRPREEALSREIARARELLPRIRYTRGDLAVIATMMAEMRVDGHRPDMVILKTARANAAFEGRTSITDRDILLAAELALPHRLRRHPLQPVEATLDNLGERLAEARAQVAKKGGMTEEVVREEEETPPAEKKTPVETEAGKTPSSNSQPRPRSPVFQQIPRWPSEGRWWEGGAKIRTGVVFTPRRLATPLDRLTRSGSGRRSTTRTSQRRGRYIQARPSPGDPSDLAFDATMRAAAPYQVHRCRPGSPALVIRSADYHRKVRVRKMGNLILFVVDASWSMAVAERMEATKGAVTSLLTDAYQRRDRVGVVVFQKNGARLVLAPTNSVSLAQKALQDIPVGGKTPLSAGLQLAYEVLTREMRRRPDLMPLMVLLTDGAGNVSIGDLPPQEEAHRIADLFPQAKIRSVVINMEHESFDQGFAQALADHLQAPCYRLEELRADTLLARVRDELDRIREV